MFYIISNWILLIWLSLASFSCRQSENSAEQIQFQVSDSLLAPCYSDTVFKFSFCPPKDCFAVPQQALDEAKAKLDLQTDTDERITFDLICFFTDTTSHAVCSLAQIFNSDSNKTTFSDLYFTVLKEKFPAGQVTKATFLIGSLPVEQYLIITDSTINFKIVFKTSNQSRLQIDYAIARSIYSEYVKRVESSIGTITVSI